MTTAAIYVRVSTEEQADQNLSIPAQLDICRRFAEERGWQVVREYQDVGSAKTADRRREFQRMIADAEGRQFNHVIVFKYSRFARSFLDSQRYEEQLEKH